MTNMKDRLRPHREAKVKFQAKRNINLKTKEKITKNVKEIIILEKETIKKNISPDIIVSKRNAKTLNKNVKDTYPMLVQNGISSTNSKDKTILSSNIVAPKRSVRTVNKNVQENDTLKKNISPKNTYIKKNDKRMNKIQISNTTISKNEMKTGKNSVLSSNMTFFKRNSKGVNKNIKNSDTFLEGKPPKRNSREKINGNSEIIVLKRNNKNFNKTTKGTDIILNGKEVTKNNEHKSSSESLYSEGNSETDKSDSFSKHHDKDKENSSPKSIKKKNEAKEELKDPQQRIKRAYVKRKNPEKAGAGPPVKSKKMNTTISSKSETFSDSSLQDDEENYVYKYSIVDKIKDESTKNVIKRKKHTCDDCGKVFLGKNDLRKHNLIHKGVKPFVCEICNKNFRQAGHLRNHVSSIHSEAIENPTVFSCDFCSKTFLIKERLRLHLRIHTGHKPYSCHLCSMRFARTGQLRQHEGTHTGERKFVCDHCYATFTCSAKLKLHIKGHLRIRDFTCYVCGKSFGRPDAIKKHLACFHNNEKPFQCPVCKKFLKGHLQEHIRTHRAEKPHGCAECGNRFAQRSQLTVHQRKHSGARPYRCRVCWKAFAHSTALTLHTRHHTGEKPFACRICLSRFAQLPHMKKHMLYLHGETRAYIHSSCGSTFETKTEYDSHRLTCERKDDPSGPETPEEVLSRQITEAFLPVEPPMKLTKMRLLLAVLLNKISVGKRLRRLGFNKRLIDDILIDSLESSGLSPCKDEAIPDAERLKINVQKFLEWTVPPQFMAKFRSENKSTEELLEELTS